MRGHEISLLRAEFRSDAREDAVKKNLGEEFGWDGEGDSLAGIH